MPLAEVPLSSRTFHTHDCLVQSRPAWPIRPRPRGSPLADARPRRPRAQVLDALKAKGISIRVASPKLVMEEAPESYKDVTQVVETCHMAGISKKAVRLRPIAVVKG